MKERIEHYFDAELTEAERREVEMELITDSDLADDTAFYLQARIAAHQAARDTLLARKHQQWLGLSEHEPRHFSRNNWISIAAAILLVILSVFYFNNPFQDDLSKRAENFLTSNLKELPVHLGDEEVSLQNAIQAY